MSVNRGLSPIWRLCSLISKIYIIFCCWIRSMVMTNVVIFCRSITKLITDSPCWNTILCLGIDRANTSCNHIYFIWKLIYTILTFFFGAYWKGGKRGALEVMARLCFLHRHHGTPGKHFLSIRCNNVAYGIGRRRESELMLSDYNKYNSINFCR